MLQFNIKKAKEVFNCDDEQRNEEFLLNTLKDYLEYFMYHNENLTTKQYHLICDCQNLINCIALVDERKENKNV